MAIITRKLVLLVTIIANEIGNIYIYIYILKYAM